MEELAALELNRELLRDVFRVRGFTWFYSLNELQDYSTVSPIWAASRRVHPQRALGVCVCFSSTHTRSSSSFFISAGVLLLVEFQFSYVLVSFLLVSSVLSWFHLFSSLSLSALIHSHMISPAVTCSHLFLLVSYFLSSFLNNLFSPALSCFHPFSYHPICFQLLTCLSFSFLFSSISASSSVLTCSHLISPASACSLRHKLTFSIRDEGGKCSFSSA